MPEYWVRVYSTFLERFYIVPSFAREITRCYYCRLFLSDAFSLRYCVLFNSDKLKFVGQHETYETSFALPRTLL
jgi:hypothetical protein